MLRVLHSACPSSNIADHIADVLRCFDHFVCCHNIVKWEVRRNRRLQRTVGEHTVQIGYAGVAIGICRI